MARSHQTGQAARQTPAAAWESKTHRELLSGEWWQKLPGYRRVDRATFLDTRWQLGNSVRSVADLAAVLGDAVAPRWLADLEEGLRLAPMAMRLTPYLLGLIDWRSPQRDPLRRQFLPLGSEHEDDHPLCRLDALAERRDSVAPGLTHRYPDKVLFLVLDVCPVYCRYCTRSYSIGTSTEAVQKVDLRASQQRWDEALAYIEANDDVEDVVMSGGDLYLLPARHLEALGRRLLSVPHLRRLRIASKGLAVMPQKILSQPAWSDALAGLARRGRERGVHVCLHTHFNHAREITELTQLATRELVQRGVTIRNQSVLLRGVNDDAESMTQLVRRLAWVGVEPYYVYLHDLVPGVETLRTTLAAAVDLEKQLRGHTAGFCTPTFVSDTVGGGGKRDLHSYEVYDEERGIAVYRSPVVAPDKAFYAFDPLRDLRPDIQRAWRNPALRQEMVDASTREAGL